MWKDFSETNEAHFVQYLGNVLKLGPVNVLGN